MKELLFFTILLYSLSSLAQSNNTQRDNIDKFIKAYLLVDNPQIDVETFPDYVYINKEDYNALSGEQKHILQKYIKLLLDLKHEELKKHNFKYNVIKNSDIDKEKIKDYRLIYPDFSKVYYLITNNDIVGHFILDNKNRIISFSANAFTSHGGRIEPFMLDKIDAE